LHETVADHCTSCAGRQAASHDSFAEIPNGTGGMEDRPSDIWSMGARRTAADHDKAPQNVRGPMFTVILYSALAVAAGISIVIQQVLNANLRVALDSAAWSVVTSYAVGVACMALLAFALRDPIPSASVAARIPWWAWGGGMFGAIFIGLAILLVPHLGAATFIALLVAGQMLASVTFDHFGWIGLVQRSADLPRLVGVALLIGGVILIQR
jgi:transporter family-2 protein